MAHTIDSRANTLAADLRDALAAVERGIVTVNADTVEALLQKLDDIEGRFESLTDMDADLRPEAGRWEGVQARLYRKPGDVATAVRQAGGFPALRKRNAPAESFWWHLDMEIAKRRATQLRQFGRSLAAIAFVVGLLYVGVTYIFPPDPNTILVVETQAQIEEPVATQNWESALAIVRTARETVPDDLELTIWEAVLLEQLGETESARLLLDDIDFDGDPSLVWVVVGNNRLLVADLDGAVAAAHDALELNSQSAQATFLLANVADTRGDRKAAIELFDQTFALAEQDDPQLAVIAKVRLGQLLQQIDPFQGQSAEESTETATE